MALTVNSLQKAKGLFIISPTGSLDSNTYLGLQEEIEAVFFFRDPLTAQPHEPDVAALLRVCDVHSVPLATNVGTANGVIKILEQKLLEQDEPVKQRSA